MIVGLYSIYDESLNEKSHQAILDLQEGYKLEENSWKVSRALKIGSATASHIYFVVPFVLYPFVCRQRFFYYLFGISAAVLCLSVLKLAFHAPRPVWMWSDV